MNIVPGADPNFKSCRQYICEHREASSKTTNTSANSTSVIIPTGYTLEAFLPWENLGIKLKLGNTFALQLIANDFDGANDSSGSLRVGWYPSVDTHKNSRMMYPIKLSDNFEKFTTDLAD